MNILEAIEQATGLILIRPVTWRGSGMAIGVSSYRLSVFPSGKVWIPMTPELADDWETVEYSALHAEREELGNE